MLVAFVNADPVSRKWMIENGFRDRPFILFSERTKEIIYGYATSEEAHLATKQYKIA